jgi:hypothetical protein
MAKIVSEFAIRIFPPKLKQITMLELVEMPLGTVYLTTNRFNCGIKNSILYFVGVFENSDMTEKEKSKLIQGVSPYTGEAVTQPFRPDVPVLILDESSENGN